METNITPKFFNSLKKRIPIALFISVLFLCTSVNAQRAFINPDFSENDPDAPSTVPGFDFFTNAEVPGWSSNNDQIEIWDSGFQTGGNTYFSNNGSPFFAEILSNNSNGGARSLSQSFCLSIDDVISWDFDHGARNNVDEILQLVLVDESDIPVPAADLIINATGSPPTADGLLVMDTVNGVGNWNDVVGSATFRGAPGVYTFKYEAVAPGGAEGNFIDDVRIIATPHIEFSTDTINYVEGEGVTTPPGIIVSGIVSADTTVNFNVTASSTANDPADYTITNSSVFIEAGEYNGTDAASFFLIDLSINNDNITEGNEIIVINFGTILGDSRVGPIKDCLDVDDELVITIEDDDFSPVATGESTTTVEDTPVTLPTIGSDDTDVDGNVEPSTIVLIDPSDPSNTGDSSTPLVIPGVGEYEVDTLGNVTFTPEEDFVGDASIEYTIEDNDGLVSNAAPIEITVTEENDAPVATGESTTTAEDTPVTLPTIGSDDTDVDGNVEPSTIVLIDPSDPSNTGDSSTPLVIPGVGEYEVDTLGNVTFTPEEDFVGDASIEYTIEDNDGLVSNAAPIEITVTEENDAPVATGESTTTVEDTPVTLPTIGSDDTDVDGNVEPSTIVLIDPSDPSNTGDSSTPLVIPGVGEYEVDTLGNVTFTPEEDFVGDASIEYTIEDNDGLVSNAAPIEITVTEENDAPVATGESTTTAEDTPVTLPTIGSDDTDVDGNVEPSTIVLIDPSDPSNTGDSSTPLVIPGVGEYEVDTLGNVTFTPEEDFVGDASIEYTIEDNDGLVSNAAPIEITVTEENDAPVATGESTTTVEDTPVTLPTIGSDDTDVDGNVEPSTIVLIDPSDPSNTGDSSTPLVIPGVGEYEVDTLGNVTFTPEEDFVGDASIEYTIEDNDGLVSNAAPIEITVTEENDAPVATGESTTTAEDTPVTLPTIGSDDTDVDGNVEPSTIVLIDPSDPSNTGDSSTPLVIPGVGEYEVDTLGNVTFTPEEDFVGDASIEYTIEDNDGLVSNAAPIEITVTEENDAPVATGESTTTVEDTPVTLPTIGSDDTDVDGNVEPSTIVLIDPSDPSNTGDSSTPLVIPGVGEYEVDTLGNVTFTPEEDFVGDASIEYTIEDNDGLVSNAAPIEITVTEENDAPVATGESTTTVEDTPVTLPTIGSDDTDVDGNVEPSTIVLIDPSDPSNTGDSSTPLVIPGVGEYEVDTLGNVTFTPEEDFVGDASIEYTIEDNDGLVSNAAPIEITVTEENDAPVATGESTTTAEDTPVTLPTIGSDDTDVDGNVEPSTIVLIDPSDPSNTGDSSTPLVIPGVGEYEVDTLGNVTFTPEEDFVGDASIEYTIEDNDGLVSNAAPIEITVTEENDAPVATGESTTTVEDTPVTLPTIGSDDTDVDGNVEPSTIVLIDPSDPSNTGDSSTPLVIPGVGEYEVDTLGNVTFTPEEDFVGDASIEYTIEDNDGLVSNAAPIEITVTEENDAPVATGESTTTVEDTPVTLPTIGSDDTDVDGNVEPSTIVLIDPSDPSNTGDSSTPLVIPGVGEYEVDTLGNVTFTPEEDFVGDASIEYTIEDNDGLVSNAAPIEITVTEENDAPVATGESTTTAEDTPVTLPTIGSDDTDVDGNVEPSTIVLIDPSDPSNTGDSSTPLVIPGVGEYEVDTLGNVTFTPEEDFVGDASIEYTIEDNDGLVSNAAPIEITVTEENDAPVATGESTTTVEDTPVTLPTIGSDDTDVDGNVEPSTIVLIDPSDPSNTGDSSTPLVIPGVGEYEVDTLGNVTFTPEEDFVGDASIEYTIEDNDGLVSNAAPIEITVTPADNIDTDNDGNPDATDPNPNVPTTGMDSGSTAPGVLTMIDILSNDDFLPNNDPNNVGTTTIVDAGTGTAGGTIVFDPLTGFLDYTPLDSEAGTDVTVVYTVCNTDTNVCENAVVTITVTEIAEAPIANNDSDEANELGETVIIDPLDNDEGDIDPATVMLIDPETGNPVTTLDVEGEGVWTVDADGLITFVPDEDLVGDPTPVEYTVANTAGTVSEPATISISYGNEIITDDPDNIAVFNFISRNNPDGLNDRLVFQGLENVNNDVVRIYNRWGVKVYETSDYGQNDNFFRGISTGRVTIAEDDQLPTGTYYYVLEYERMDGTPRNKAGYIYIN